jgi:hypothetical protein
VDQFEEVFTHRPGDEQAKTRFERSRLAFFANLLNAAAKPGGRVAVVLTMRSDFLGACALFPKLNAALNSHLVQVGPMLPAELRAAIERPAYLASCEVEPALTERILADVAGQPGALPLVEFALKEVWNQRDGRKLTIAAYEALGGIAGALEHRANEVFQSFQPDEKEECKRIFLRLVQPGEGTEDTKRRVAYRELLPEDPIRADRIRQVVSALADRDARLITTDKSREAEGELEVAHEALIRGWKQLRVWIEADRAGLRTHRRLTDAARQWSEASQEAKNDFLYTGARQAEASEWAKGHASDLSGMEHSFLRASQESEQYTREKEIADAKRQAEADAERERQAALLAKQAQELAEEKSRRAEEQAKTARQRADEASAAAKAQAVQRRRFQVAAVVAVVLAVIAGALALWANQAAKEANEQKAVAEANARIAESRRLSALSDSLRPQQLDVAMLLALEASREDTLEARAALQRCLEDRPELSQFLDVPEGEVTSVAVDHQGRLAAGYAGRHGSGGGVVLFDPRGERALPGPLEVKEGAVTSVAFDARDRLAAGYKVTNRGGVVLFDALGDGARRMPLEVKEGEVTSVAFDAQGRVAAGYCNGPRFSPKVRGVVLFDAKGGRVRSTPLEGKDGIVQSVAFDAHGRLAVGFDSGNIGGVVLLDAQGECLQRGVLEVQEGPVMSVAFDTQGQLAAGYSGYPSSGVVLFDARGERLRPAPIGVAEGSVASVAFDTQGRLAVAFASIGDKGGVVLFDSRGARLRRVPLEVKEGTVSSVAFDAQGRLAVGVVGSERSGAEVFDVRAERVRQIAKVTQGSVSSVALDSQGRLAAGYGSKKGKGGVVLFDRRGALEPSMSLEVSQGSVSSVAFDSQGRLAAGYVKGSSGGVELFDTRGERVWRQPLDVKQGGVTSVAFDAQGRLAVGYEVSGAEHLGGVELFDSRGECVWHQPLEGNEGGVTSVAFDAQGELAAGYRAGAATDASSEASRHSGVVLFDIRGERVTPSALKVEGQVVSVAFDAQGRLAAAYSEGVELFDARHEPVRRTPLEVKDGHVRNVSFDSQGRLAVGYNVRSSGAVVLFDERGERAAPMSLEEDRSVTAVAFDARGGLAAGFSNSDSSGVMLFDVDRASWKRKLERTANRNFTRREWERYFPGSTYRRTIGHLPWPTDPTQ